MSVAAASNTNDLYKVDVKLCYPFIEAVVNTLKIQCKLTATPGKPYFKSNEMEDKIDVIISATISSKDNVGCVNICYSKKTFLAIMGKMLGESYGDITPELEDGAKEIMNIVFNQAKKPLADKGMAAVRSIPNVIFGSNLRVRYLTRGTTIVLPFDTEVGPFIVEVSTQHISVSDSV